MVNWCMHICMSPSQILERRQHMINNKKDVHRVNRYVGYLYVSVFSVSLQ